MLADFKIYYKATGIKTILIVVLGLHVYMYVKTGQIIYFM